MHYSYLRPSNDSLVFNTSYHTLINEMLHLLSESFPIKFIGYLRLYSNGTAVGFSSNLKWQEFFLQKIDGNSQNFEKATLLSNSSEKYFLHMWPDSIEDKTLGALHSYNIWNGMSLYRNHEGYTDSWSFAGEVQDTALATLFVKSTNLFERFIEYVETRYSFLFVDNDLPIFKFSHNRLIQPPDDLYCTEQYVKNFMAHSPIFGKYLPNLLTNRKIAILDCLSLAMTDKEIARKLNISHRTVESHLKDVRNMLGCKSRSEMVIKYKESTLA